MEGPLHVFLDANTVYVTVSGVFPLFTIVITGKLPEPPTENPLRFGLLETPVQLYCGVLTPLVHVTSVVATPEHFVCDKTVFVTLGVGFIVTINEAVVPTHELYVGVT